MNVMNVFARFLKPPKKPRIYKKDGMWACSMGTVAYGSSPTGAYAQWWWATRIIAR